MACCAEKHVLLFAVVLAFAGPRPAPSADLTAAVNRAIDRGRAALLPKLQAQIEKLPADYAMGRIALSLAAILKSGLPSDHETVARAFQTIEKLPVEQTYSVACYLFALDAYWQARYKEGVRRSQEGKAGPGEAPVPSTPPPGPVRQKLEDLVSWLARGQGGTWTYTGRGPGDLSNTQFAVLGLEIGLDNEIDVPAEVFQRVTEHLVGCHSTSGKPQQFTVTYRTPAWEGITTGVTKNVSYMSSLGGWNYVSSRTQPPSNTMTAAGVSSLLVARKALRKANAFPPETAREVDGRIAAGLGWMAANFKTYLGHYYGMYSLEKVGDIGGILNLGTVNWYEDGASYLVSKQGPDGSWGDEVNTAFALLFLTRATRSHLQSLGPPVVFTRQKDGGTGAPEDALSAVYIDKVKGFVSTDALFDFILETRDPRLVPYLDQAVSATPPHEIHRTIERVLSLWDDKEDTISKHSREVARKLAGMPSGERAAIVALARSLRRMREIEEKGTAEEGEVEALLRGSPSTLLKRRALDFIDRVGRREALGDVIEELVSPDADVRRRAREVLVRWSGQDFPDPGIAEGAAGPDRSALEAAAVPWRRWWEGEIENLKVARQAGVLIEKIERDQAVEDAVRALTHLGPEAIPAILKAMEKEGHSIHLIRALEQITGKEMGIRAADWRQGLWQDPGGK